MAYDPSLAGRVRKVLSNRRGVSEKEMFGGIAFLLGGHMFCGIVKDDLMVRIGPDGHEAALKEPHVRPMDFTGQPMKGYVFVAPDGCRSPAALARWVGRGAEFAATLPARTTRRR